MLFIASNRRRLYMATQSSLQIKYSVLAVNVPPEYARVIAREP
jgi:hypothetical protein